MKIMVVDDEERIRHVVKEYCIAEGYQVVEADDGMMALDLLKIEDIDCLILDIMMPRLDGYSAYKEMIKVKKVPTIMLSARGEEYDKLLGFELGIDDYLTKPFSPKELIARIKAVTKRQCGNSDVFCYRSLMVDFLGHTVQIGSEVLSITPKEYDLLCYFIKNSRIALSREQLLRQVWGYDFYGDDRTIDTHVKMLRNNLREYRDLIVTVRGMGYKFEIKE